MKTWIKLYTEIIDDPDIGGLSLENIGIWSLFLTLAGKIDARNAKDEETGQLDTPERIAWYLRRPLEQLRPAIEEFVALGMVHEQDGVLYLTNYGKRQARPPSAKRDAVRDRVRKYRAQTEDEEDESEESNDVTESLPTQCNDLPSVSVSASVSPSLSLISSDPENIRHKQENIRQREAEETLEQHPDVVKYDWHTPLHLQENRTPAAIRVYQEVMRTRPAPGTPMYEAIVDTVTDEPASLDRWREALTEWIMRGYKRNNIAGLLDWYTRGVPPRGSPREIQQFRETEAAEEEQVERVKAELEAARRRFGSG